MQAAKNSSDFFTFHLRRSWISLLYFMLLKDRLTFTCTLESRLFKVGEDHWNPKARAGFTSRCDWCLLCFWGLLCPLQQLSYPPQVPCVLSSATLVSKAIRWVAVTPDLPQMGKNQALDLHDHYLFLFKKLEEWLNINCRFEQSLTSRSKFSAVYFPKHFLEEEKGKLLLNTKRKIRGHFSKAVRDTDRPSWATLKGLDISKCSKYLPSEKQTFKFILFRSTHVQSLSVQNFWATFSAPLFLIHLPNGEFPLKRPFLRL